MYNNSVRIKKQVKQINKKKVMDIKSIADVLYAEFEKSETIISIDEVSPIEDEEIINISIKVDPDYEFTIEDYVYTEICQYIDYVLKKLNVCADFDLAYESIDDNTLNIYGTLTIE